MKKNVLNVFGQTIRLLRTQKKISQEELAEICGFHRTYIGQIERGERNPSLKNIEVFAVAFELSLGELFTAFDKLNEIGQS